MAVFGLTVSTASAKHPDIVTTATDAGSFKTLLAALEATDLVEARRGEGPFTVFAPTDEAFGKLPEGTLEKLLLPESKAMLASILTYHVIPGRVFSSDLADGAKVKTVQGSTFSVSVCCQKGVQVNGVTVAKADIDASNGVIHVIGSVLMPPVDGSTTSAALRHRAGARIASSN